MNEKLAVVAIIIENSNQKFRKKRPTPAETKA
jgi:hypothetical protein